MSSYKLTRLNELKKEINMNVRGNFYKEADVTNIFVGNHSCLKDCFYIPMALDHEIVVVVSARVAYKNIGSRKRVFDDNLYTMPMEAHGGKIYSTLCLNYITNLIKSGIDISIFPEGAYVEDNAIFKGRTGVARILFDALSENSDSKINFIPVAIDVDKEKQDLDSYYFDNENITVSFLPPIDYMDDYEKYMTSNDIDEKRRCLHNVTNQALRNIARELNKDYVDSYIELYPKGNVMFSDGNVIPTEEVQSSYYASLYETSLKNRYDSIVKQLVKK